VYFRLSHGTGCTLVLASYGGSFSIIRLLQLALCTTCCLMLDHGTTCRYIMCLSLSYTCRQDYLRIRVY